MYLCNVVFTFLNGTLSCDNSFILYLIKFPGMCYNIIVIIVVIVGQYLPSTFCKSVSIIAKILYLSFLFINA